MRIIAESALDLSRLIRPGERLVWSHACAEPTTLLERLIDQASSVGGLTAFAASSFSGITERIADAGVGLSSMGAIGTLRAVADKHALSIIPCHVSELPHLLRTGAIGCDVALIQISPPDESGRHSLGLTADFTLALIQQARIVIAEINDQVPFTIGCYVGPVDIDYAIEVSRVPVEVRRSPEDDVSVQIGRHASNFIPDRATLQIGIGAAPDAILRALTDRRDLGIHSGVIGDGIMSLIEQGVVSNAYKGLDEGVSIATTLIGTDRLYRYGNHNPAIQLRASNYTHNRAVIARLKNFVAINSAIEIDLTGQVNAEAGANRYVGGTGGQADFIRGALGADGRSIIALPSTTSDGKMSRIVDRLPGPVTCARVDVDIVVTEFGAVELRGKAFAERARLLTQIAHPEMRSGLATAAAKIAEQGH